MTQFNHMTHDLKQLPSVWLITGVAGFIGSNLLEALLTLNQKVVGIDNFATGSQMNLDDVRSQVTPTQWQNFDFIYGDVTDYADCQKAMYFSTEDERLKVDYVLHQAALGSVPRSLDEPLSTNKTNITGFLNILMAAHHMGVRRVIYSSSSSTYGDNTNLPKVEGCIGMPLSPYAVTKQTNELYADVFTKSYHLNCVGLRYFNVFGRRQRSYGDYAAVTPAWIATMLNHAPITINGDGQTTRDFCYVDNVVQANILAALSRQDETLHQRYNIAHGRETSLNQLFDYIKDAMAQQGFIYTESPRYNTVRKDDIRYSKADIAKARQQLAYSPCCDVQEGINRTVAWYLGKGYA